MNLNELLQKLDDYKIMITTLTNKVEELEIDNRFLSSELYNETQLNQQLEYKYLKLRGEI